MLCSLIAKELLTLRPGLRLRCPEGFPGTLALDMVYSAYKDTDCYYYKHRVLLCMYSVCIVSTKLTATLRKGWYLFPRGLFLKQSSLLFIKNCL
jgi:hypothetical protein